MEDSQPPTTNAKPNRHFAPGAKPRGKPSSANRMTDFRTRKGTDALAEIHGAARARTTVSLDAFINIFNDLKLQPTQTTVALSGTTRGIGFNVTHEYENAVTAFPKANGLASPNCVYRIALGQLDLQLLESEPRGLSLNEHVQPERPQISPKLTAAVRTCTQNLAGVSETVNQFGHFSHAGKQYRTLVNAPLPPTVGRRAKRARINEFTPDPFRVTLMNLRATVEYLNDPGTPRAVREHFIRNNPLPGANFVDGILMNPQDIIKESYTFVDMLDDIAKFKRFAACIKDKGRFANVKLDGIGSPAALMTAYKLDMRLTADNVLECLSDDDFYTSESLEHGFVVLGIIGLCGEITPPTCAGPRSPEACYASYNTSWYTLRTRLDPN